jgi:hypothetical protein
MPKVTNRIKTVGGAVEYKKGQPLQENQNYTVLQSNTYFMNRKLPT